MNDFVLSAKEQTALQEITLKRTLLTPPVTLNESKPPQLWRKETY